MDISEVKTEKELFSNEDNKKLLLERYGDMESVMFAVHNLKQKEGVFGYIGNENPTTKTKYKALNFSLFSWTPL